MKRFVYVASALSLLAAAGSANGDDWADLDRAVADLTASLQDNSGGPVVGGYIIANYVSSSDITAGSGELGGFNLPNARIGVTGMQGGYEYKAQYNLPDNTIKDIWIRFPLADSVSGMIGNYKPTVLLSGLISTSKLFFFDRSVAGEFSGTRDLGFQLYGGFEADVVNWFVSVQNGADTVADDYYFSGRAQFNVIGEAFKDPKFKGVEGAQNGTEDPSGTIAVSAFDDGAVQDGDGFAGEFHLKTNVYSLGGEVLDLGEGVSGATDPEGDRLKGFVDDYYNFGDFAGITLQDNSNPFSVQATYMVSATEGNATGWEVGARYQDFDNVANDSLIEVGVRRYLVGHKLKWGVFFVTTDSDDPLNEFDLVAVDLVVGY